MFSDLTAVDHTDSAVVGQIVKSHAALAKSGGVLQLAGPHGMIESVVKTTEVDKVIVVYPSALAASDGFPPAQQAPLALSRRRTVNHWYYRSIGAFLLDCLYLRCRRNGMKRHQMATTSSLVAHRETLQEPEAPSDGRKRRRIAVSLPLHVRPFDSRFAEIEDVGEVVNFTRDGLLFVTCMPHYFMGMRLIITFPFGDTISAHRRFLGVVVRQEERPKGASAVAVRFLL